MNTTNTNLATTNTNLANNYCNKISTDTLLNTKQPNLTAATTLLAQHILMLQEHYHLEIKQHLEIYN
jgi:hypothetical protein